LEISKLFQKVGKGRVCKIRLGKFRLARSGLNPIKLITPTPKFWSWRNYEKSLFQSYKDIFITQNHAKRRFFGVNFGIISTPKFVRRKLRQKMTF
jgi:hypothetical protein